MSAPTRRWQSQFVRAAVVTDTIMILVALVIAQVVRFGGDSSTPTPLGAYQGNYVLVAVFLFVAWALTLFCSQSYRPALAAIGNEMYLRILRSSFYLFGVFAIAALLFRLPLSRGYVAIVFPTGVALLICGRLLIRRQLIKKRLTGRCMDTTVLVGAAPEVRYVADRIVHNPAAGYTISAVATGATTPGTFQLRDGRDIPDAGPVPNALLIATAAGADTIIIAGHAHASDAYLRELGWSLEGTGISLVLTDRMIDVAGPRIHRTPVEGLPLISLEPPRYDGGRYLLKRVFDVLLASTLLMLLSPVFIVITVAIWAHDRGPVFFRQERVGVGASTFTMTKFRSMVPHAHEQLPHLTADTGAGPALFKMRHDPRITRVGAILRASSLDELPQLFDVLAGHMSMVGPRPALPSEVNNYHHHTHRRLNVKPGITGPWQVSGRSNLSWEDSLRKDLYYVENWTLLGDCILLIKTIKAVLARDGAY